MGNNLLHRSIDKFRRFHLIATISAIDKKHIQSICTLIHGTPYFNAVNFVYSEMLRNIFLMNLSGIYREHNLGIWINRNFQRQNQVFVMP